MTAAATVRRARERAGLTQAQLAERMGTTQPVVARLERPGSNPTLATLEDALDATGHALELRLRRRKYPDVDEGQILEYLKLTPAERLRTFEASNANLLRLLRSARRAPR